MHKQLKPNSKKKLKLKLIQGDDEAYDRLIENGTPIANNKIPW